MLLSVIWCVSVATVTTLSMVEQLDESHSARWAMAQLPDAARRFLEANGGGKVRPRFSTDVALASGTSVRLAGPAKPPDYEFDGLADKLLAQAAAQGMEIAVEDRAQVLRVLKQQNARARAAWEQYAELLRTRRESIQAALWDDLVKAGAAAIALPLLLFVLGWAVAWVRRGFVDRAA